MPFFTPFLVGRGRVPRLKSTLTSNLSDLEDLGEIAEGLLGPFAKNTPGGTITFEPVGEMLLSRKGLPFCQFGWESLKK